MGLSDKWHSNRGLKAREKCHADICGKGVLAGGTASTKVWAGGCSVVEVWQGCGGGCGGGKWEKEQEGDIRKV